jgi:hypothetical protein
MKKYFVDLLKFLFIFFLFFTFGQLLKNPVEFALINSNIINYVPQIVYPLLLALPNFFFYIFAGIGLSMVIKNKILFWLLLFCVLELSWRLYFGGPLILSFGGFYGYLLVYSRKIIIPIAIFLGNFLQKKIEHLHERVDS